MTFKKFKKIAVELGWNVSVYENDINLQQYTSFGQDFFFTIQKDKELISQVYSFYESYDPCEEALLWTGSDGHGKNGAPHELKDIIKDMEECEQMVKELYEKLIENC